MNGHGLVTEVLEGGGRQRTWLRKAPLLRIMVNIVNLIVSGLILEGLS